MTTGNRIRTLRRKAGITQAELAQKLGIPYQSIGQWERGLRSPKYETLKKIAKALEVDIYDLLDDKEREIFVDAEASVLIHGLGKKYSFSEEEQTLVSSFNRLNQTGKKIAVSQVETLTKFDELTDRSQSAADIEEEG